MQNANIKADGERQLPGHQQHYRGILQLIDSCPQGLPVEVKAPSADREPSQGWPHNVPSLNSGHY